MLIKKISVMWAMTAFLTLLGGCGTSDSELSETTQPETGTLPIDSSATLVVNEIVAKDAAGGSDWIELYALDANVDLTEFTIVDDDPSHEPQSLPEITLNAGEFIVIYAIDEEDIPPEDGYYVTFKLGASDALTLYQNGTEVDSIAWEDGEAAEGYSFGRLVDGSGELQTLTPTPGAANQAADAPDDDAERDTLINENAELRINEIVAKASWNDSDNNSNYDWIELFASGNNSVNLADYQIADESGELSALPSITLAPGEYYRLYATTDLNTGLETVNFKLGASDSVSLYINDDLVDRLAWNNGEALSGYSFGRFPDGSDAIHTLSPTPGMNNQQTSHGPLVINEVVANDSSGGDDWFEIYNNSNQVIELAHYQVIDDNDEHEAASLPNILLGPYEYFVIYANEESQVEFSVPFKLGSNDSLSLIFNEQIVDYIEWDESDVISGLSYGLPIDGSWQKDSLEPTPGATNQPVTVFNKESVTNLYIEIEEADWQDMMENALDEEYHAASIRLNDVSLETVAIRTKGNSSLRSVSEMGSERFSFKVDINEYVEGQKFFGLKKFTLQNSFNDPSYMREVIAYELLDEMGVASPQHAYVNFYVNGQLHGLYLMVEAIDGEFLEDHFENSEGDLYKPDGVGSDLVWIDDDFTSYSGVDLETNEESTDNGAFINLVKQMQFGDALSVIDAESVLRYLSVSVVLSNLDSYHGPLAHNYYLYEQDGVFSLLPWDLNEAFGSFSMGCQGKDVRELFIDEPTVGPLAEKPLIAKLLENEAHLASYHEILWQLIEGPLSSNEFRSRVTSIAEKIAEHVANDPTAFYSSAEFEQNLDQSVGRFYGLTSFIDYRVENIKQQLLGNLPSKGDGSGFCTGGGMPPPPGQS